MFRNRKDNINKSLKGLFIVLVMFFTTSIASAQDNEDTPQKYLPPPIGSYENAELGNLTQLGILLGALDLNHPKIMGDYARLFYCEIYQDFFTNDYEWLKISKAIQNDFRNQKDTISRTYYFVTDFELERYDLTDQSFPLVRKNRLENVGEFEVLKVKTSKQCGLNFPGFLPETYSIALKKPLNFDRIPISSDRQLQRISEIPMAYDEIRIVKAVFYFQVEGVAELEKYASGYQKNISFIADLDRMLLFADGTFSELIYQENYR